MDIRHIEVFNEFCINYKKYYAEIKQARREDALMKVVLLAEQQRILLEENQPWNGVYDEML